MERRHPLQQGEAALTSAIGEAHGDAIPGSTFGEQVFLLPDGRVLFYWCAEPGLITYRIIRPGDDGYRTQPQPDPFAVPDLSPQFSTAAKVIADTNNGGRKYTSPTTVPSEVIIGATIFTGGAAVVGVAYVFAGVLSEALPGLQGAGVALIILGVGTMASSPSQARAGTPSNTPADEDEKEFLPIEGGLGAAFTEFLRSGNAAPKPSGPPLDHGFLHHRAVCVEGGDGEED